MPAITHYEVIEQFGVRACLLTCRLETGRTHQIRIHLAEIDHPVVGDPVYGAPRDVPASRFPFRARPFTPRRSGSSIR